MRKLIRPLLFLILAALAGITTAQAATVTVAWDPNPEPDVTGYVVHWGTQSRVYPSSQTVGRVTSWVTPNLSPGQTFYFAVQAVNVDGMTSPLSDEVSFTVPLTFPGGGPLAVPGDFSGTGRARPAVFRRSAGEWYLQGRGGVGYGRPEDVPVPGDYDGDGRVDIAVWRPSTATWWVLPSSTSTSFSVQWGSPSSNDQPLPADFDGDGRTDLAIWRPETGVWWILKSSESYSYGTRWMIQWGNPNGHDEPVPADYDGDGRADIAVWRPETGMWWILRSSDQYSVSTRRTYQWGNPASNDVPVPADYDGDGRADIAVWRPGSGLWWILKSTDNYSVNTRWLYQWGIGSEGDMPVPADFDGDGRADLGIYRPGSAYWYVRQSAGNYDTYWNAQYGNAAAGDVPAFANPAVLRRQLGR